MRCTPGEPAARGQGFDRLACGLRAVGFSEPEINQALGGNGYRFMAGALSPAGAPGSAAAGEAA
ncbi:MAG: hypothetical protein M3Y41_01520 [Pseudomonadota bacterium]|nr:hypothetical protein [Pseudomonadota bacterium]